MSRKVIVPLVPAVASPAQESNDNNLEERESDEFESDVNYSGEKDEDNVPGCQAPQFSQIESPNIPTRKTIIRPPSPNLTRSFQLVPSVDDTNDTNDDDNGSTTQPFKVAVPLNVIPQSPNLIPLTTGKRSKVVNFEVILPAKDPESIQSKSNRVTSLRFDGPSGKIENDEIEQTLVDLGYIVIAKVVIQGTDGAKEARYVEAINRLGQKVYIELDLEGQVAVRTRDLTMIESKDATVIPYSVKVGALECAGLDVCGVAFTCKDNICVVSHDDNVNPQETNFVFIKERAPEIGLISTDGVTSIYPIVKLSEIVANPALVLRSTNDVTRRIRSATFAGCNDGLEKFKETINRLNDNFLAFDRVYTQAATELPKRIQQLEENHVQFLNLKDPTDADREIYRKLVDNLRKRNEYLVELLKMCEVVYMKQQHLSKYAAQLKESAEFIQNEIDISDRVLV